jgi:hypothetical protein
MLQGRWDAAERELTAAAAKSKHNLLVEAALQIIPMARDDWSPKERTQYIMQLGM